MEVKCPYCGRPAMTLLRKSAMGPGRIIACEACNKPVTAHWLGIFAALPAFLGAFAFMRTTSPVEGMAAIVGGLAAMVLLQMFVVPLVRVER